jgi:serine/threonine protein kinase
VIDPGGTVAAVPPLQPSPTTDDSEETRAFLQARLALFWKVLFMFTGAGVLLGLLGPMGKPGADVAITAGNVAMNFVLWQLCRRGKRSIRFSRTVEATGLVVSGIIGVFLTRYLLAAFSQQHALVTAEGALMADAYICMIDLAPFAMFLAIRAALIPSQPRRTAILTAVVAAVKIFMNSILVPTGDGGLAWRDADQGAFPWLPSTLIMMWVIAVLTCTVISWVVYGLRAEVREARRFGQYILERKVGEGAMGVVYRATHSMLRRPAAIKLLLKDRATENDLLRFEREVQLTSRLVHPNTISIFDYGRTAEGVFYYVMEYLDGMDLQRLVGQYGPVAPARTIHILAQISGALAEAHALGLIHRDIKPANIILTERPDEPDVVKVVDFGLVKKFGGDLAESTTDTMAGTPLYMAPEAISKPDTIDGRSDLYAVGAVAYFLLTGEHVFEAGSVLEVCSKHMLEKPIAPSERLGKPLPEDLEAIVLACLAKDRNDRPASAAVLRTKLLACADAASNDLAAARVWWETFRVTQKDQPQARDRRRWRSISAAGARFCRSAGDPLRPRASLEHDLEALHPPVQRLTTHAEIRRGLRDNALRTDERLFDHTMIGTELFELCGLRGFRWSSLARFAIETEVLGLDRAAGAHERGSLDPVLELAHIAGPVVGE